MARKKNKLFSVTADDCRWDYYTGGGPGGQNRNKSQNAVRCHHDASGALGQAQDSRDQRTNKKLAFERMIASKEFQGWLKLEIDVKTNKVKIEVQDGKGQWREKDFEEKLDS